MRLDANLAFLAVAATSSVGLVVLTLARNGARSGFEYIKASPSEVIGPSPVVRGEPKSPATVVMFFDYQCPPCKKAHRAIEALLDERPGRFRLVYRNFPLSSIHPYAAEAALAALAAREQGKFFPLHDRLLAADLRAGEVEGLVRGAGLDPKRLRASLASSAKAELESDEAAGRRLGVTGTPTLFLCLPDGRVARLSSPGELERFIDGDA